MRLSELAALGLCCACYSAHASEPERTPPASAPRAALTVAAAPRCPAEMAEVERPQGSFCIDRWEATLAWRRPNLPATPWPGNRAVDGREAELFAESAAGRMPQGYISGDQAERACVNAGKRLCEIDEWTRACRGPRGRTYPYGDERRAGVCNDRFKTLDAHPVERLYDQLKPKDMARLRMWEPFFMNDPRLHELSQTVERTGSRSGCVTETGVYDLVGNLHEWVADPAGTFVGGFFMDTRQNGEGCGYRTTAHRRDYRDYSTGFRCCADVQRSVAAAPIDTAPSRSITP
ncbi:MAG: formylglycine-generating enzyme family protein [Myxococcota bacterium]|nr:formylglycine-generating enzyme family protein [Myxococcota bacterium]